MGVESVVLFGKAVLCSVATLTGAYLAHRHLNRRISHIKGVVLSKREFNPPADALFCSSNMFFAEGCSPSQAPLMPRFYITLRCDDDEECEIEVGFDVYDKVESGDTVNLQLSTGIMMTKVTLPPAY